MWLLFVSSALAGASEDDLRTSLSTSLAQHGAPDVVLAAGALAEDLVRRSLMAERMTDVPVARVPLSGDLAQEVDLAVKRVGLDPATTCALRVERKGASWDLSRHGACGAPEAVATTAAPAPTDPASASVAPAEVAPASETPVSEAPAPEAPPTDPAPADPAPGEPTAGPTAAPEEGDPTAGPPAAPGDTTAGPPAAPEGDTTAGPTAAPEGDAAPTVPTRGQREADYAKRRLELQDSPGEEPPWSVIDGEGAEVSARRLAVLIDDRDLIAKLDKEKQAADRRARITRIVGWTLVAGSPVAMAGVELGTEAAEDRFWTSGFLAATGGMALYLAPRHADALRERQGHAAGYFDAALVEDAVRLHNQALFAELGLDAPAEGAPVLVVIQPESSPPTPDSAEAQPDAGPGADPDAVPEAVPPAEPEAPSPPAPAVPTDAAPTGEHP